ncbi:MAG: serine protease [Casimicrobiaceae bacterium]
MKLPFSAFRILFAAGALLGLLETGAGAAWAGMPETIERVKPSIVAVGTFQKTRSPAFAFRGTGFAVGDGTLIATNAHVLPEALQTEGLESIMVMIAGVEGSGPQPREAKTVAIDRQHDLALLRVTGAPLPAMRLGNPATVREGQTALFTGFPIGSVLGLFPVTHRGMIASITPIALPSATAQQLDERLIRRLQSGAFPVFQLDATAYPGNSGSPLYDIETGAVIGIMNMVFVKGTKETALSQPSGISFAVPVQFLQELLRTAN